MGDNSLALRLLCVAGMKNVVNLATTREIKAAEAEEYAYRAKILAMDKLELLEEMVRFQEERSQRKSLSLDLMIRGRHLFKELEERAETQELRHLTRSYRRHLDLEIDQYRRKKLG